MNRRSSQRIKRRIPCDFSYEGHTYAGIVVDLSGEGLFLQTDTAIDPGAELSLRLRTERVGELVLRGRVVRRRFTPAVLASMIRRGVGIRVLEAPRAFYELLGVEPPRATDQLWQQVDDWGVDEAPVGPVAIDIQLDEGAAVGIDLELEDGVEPLGDAPTASTRRSAPTADAGLSEGSPDEQDATEPARVEPVFEDHWEALDTDALPAAGPWMPESLCRADALLIDDGELDDVNALLEAIGADPVRHRAVDSQGFTGWEAPPRVVVAAARSALRLSVGPAVEGQGIVTIAVADTSSQVVTGMLRRQGFRYIVRRPVHPEALRLLLLRALFRGRERREAPRVPLGCEIALRLTLARRPATLLDLSRTGCRLFTRDWHEPGDRIGLRIPRGVTGGRPLGLAGRITRAERRRQTEPAERVALALRFDRLEPTQRLRLEALIERHAGGPPALPYGARPGPGKTAAAAHVPAPPQRDRRLSPRAPHREEVLALDPALQRVRFALFGVDLSPVGLRVEPHPELALGDALQLALYDAVCTTSLTVSATVARDDGPQGLLLRFDPLDEAAASELVRILERSPQLEATVAGEGRRLILGEVVKPEPA